MEGITKTSNELINNLLDERIDKVISRFESTKKYNTILPRELVEKLLL